MSDDDSPEDSMADRIRAALEGRPDVVFAYLFGSRAVGRPHPRTKSRYCDLRPLRERLDRAVSERIESGRFGRRSEEGGS